MCGGYLDLRKTTERAVSPRAVHFSTVGLSGKSPPLPQAKFPGPPMDVQSTVVYARSEFRAD